MKVTEKLDSIVEIAESKNAHKFKLSKYKFHRGSLTVVVLDNYNVAAILEDMGNGRFQFNYNTGNVVTGSVSYATNEVTIELYRPRWNAHMKIEATYIGEDAQPAPPPANSISTQ